MNRCLALRLPRESIFANPLQISRSCQGFWSCCKTSMSCSLLARCTTPPVCHTKQRIHSFGTLISQLPSINTWVGILETSKPATTHPRPMQMHESDWWWQRFHMFSPSPQGLRRYTLVGIQWIRPSTSCQFHRSAMTSSGCQTGKVLSAGSGSTISLQAGSCTAVGKRVVIERLCANVFQPKSPKNCYSIFGKPLESPEKLEYDNLTIPKNHVFPHPTL